MEEEILILDYLNGNLSKEDRQKVDGLRETSTSFAGRFTELQILWHDLDLRNPPEISEQSVINFTAMLKTFELEKELPQNTFSAKAKQWLISLFTYQPKFNWAYAVMLVTIGAFGAYVFLQSHRQSQRVQENDNKMQAMILELLENPVAVQRMKAVSYSENANAVNDKVIDALLVTINSDPDDNVRLVTLNALVKLAANPKVREGLVNSIVRQTSPLMQVAIADVMVKLQEKKAIRYFKALLDKQKGETDLIHEKLDETVKLLETI